jgi:hypothetical protein
MIMLHQGGLGRRLYQAAVLALVMLGSLALYLTVLWWRGPSAVLSTQTAWDRRIPFHVTWVWVYLIPYLLGPLIAALLSAGSFAWYIRRGLVVVAVSLFIFILLPTRTVRPDPELVAALGDAWTAEIYRSMAAIDGPAANAAPSLHVSLTCLLAWAVVRDFRRGWPIWFACALVVWAATLFTWQHHLIDVGTGVLLATLVAFWPLRTAPPPCRITQFDSARTAGGRHSSLPN